MNTFDIGNNIKAVILFALVLIAGVVLVIKGFSTNDITSLVMAIIGIVGGAGLVLTEKVELGGNEEGNDETE